MGKARSVEMRRTYRRVARGLAQMRKKHADGILLVLLDEHNSRDEQAYFESVATAIGGCLKKRGFYVEVDAYETTQMGGQHMEWINHVTLTVRHTQPMDSHAARQQRLLEC